MLKLKFRKLHEKVARSVNPASIIDLLSQKDVIGTADLRALHRIRDDPQQQCNDLLAVLHTSENPQAFIHLYQAIEKESQLNWLIEEIDTLNDQSLITLLEQLYLSERTGYVMFYRRTMCVHCD